MEILVVIAALAIFLGPTAYHTYTRYKRVRQGLVGPEEKKGPSYGRRLLGMMGPVFVLIAFLALLAIGLYILGGSAPPVGAVAPVLSALL